MTANEELRNKIRDLCRDPEYAVTMFLAAFVYPYSPDDFWRYAELYGLNKGKAKEILGVVESLVYEAEDEDQLFALLDHLREASSECVEVFSSELVKNTRERIERLQDLEAKALRYASYFIKLFKAPYEKTKAFHLSFTDADPLAETLCAALSVSRNHVQNIARIVLAKTGIAFYVFSPSIEHEYHDYFIPPYAPKIVEELAKEVEEEVRRAEEVLRELNDAKALSAILIKLRSTGLGYSEQRIFEAVYGDKLDDYLKKLRIPGVCYDGCVNHLLRDAVSRVAADLAVERFDKFYRAVKRALNNKGFRISTVIGPTDEEPYGTIVASKSEGYEVVVQVMPFPYRSLSGSNEVLVFEGPIAQPDEFKDCIVVGMSENFDHVKVVVDNINAEWSREVVEVFRTLHIEEVFVEDATHIQHPQPKLVKAGSLLDEGSEIAKIVRGFPARDILESVVAAALKNLGFEVRVNHKIRARDGVDREVDVWAWKNVAGIQFKVYVSCKNLDRDVGAPVVDQEAGRVAQLAEVPHIKFIVASKFGEQGKRVALADGFIPIEVGFKVDEANVVEACRRVYKTMSEVFTAIAPRRLQQLAEAVAKISEQLKSIYEELSGLTSSYSV